MVKERISILSREDSGFLDDAELHFGTGSTGVPGDFTNYDWKMGWSSDDNRMQITPFRPTVSEQNRAYAIHVDLDNFFTGTGSPQTRAMVLTGDRTEVMGGDAHDWLMSLEYTNEAINTPAGSYARGLNVSLNNSDAGEIGSLQGAFISCRQRGDGDALVNLLPLRIDLVHNVGGEAATGQEVGVAVEIQMEANGPAQADTTGNAGLRIDQRTDGVYTNLPDGIQLRNRGTSSCKGFRYGIDFYDSRAASCDLGEIRFMTADGSGLPAILTSGTATDDSGIVSDIGADTNWADGSLYVSVSDGAGKLFIKTADTWTSAI